MKKLKKISIKRCFATKSSPRGTYIAYRPKYDLWKIKWEINPYDGDENPRWSIPHGDDIYPKHHTLKLDVYSGYIYSAQGYVYKGKLSKKELARLHNDPGFQRAKDEALKHRNCANKHTRCKRSLFTIDLECHLKKSNS